MSNLVLLEVTIRQELTLRSLFFCDRDTNTSPGRLECQPQQQSSVLRMLPTIHAGLSAGVKEWKHGGAYDHGAITRESLESKSGFGYKISGKISASTIRTL